MEVEKRGKRSKRSPTSSDEKLPQRLKREGVEVEMQEARPKRRAAEGVSYTQPKPKTTERRMVTVRRAPRLKAFLENVPAQQPLPALQRVTLSLPAEYYRPRSNRSSSSNSSVRVSKSSSSSNGSYNVSDKLTDQNMIDKLEALELGEYEFKNLPKISRKQKYIDQYNELMKQFKETIIKPIQQINAESELIDRMYFTLHEDDTQWLENLKKNNIRKSDLTKLNKLVTQLEEVGEELPNTYEKIHTLFKNLLDEEFAELSTIYSLVLQKQQHHLGELDMGAQHKYYFDYYSKRLEDLDKLMDVFKEVRSKVKTLFDDYTVKMGQAYETILKAIEFMDRYNKAIEEGEIVDELAALFKNL